MRVTTLKGIGLVTHSIYCTTGSSKAILSFERTHTKDIRSTSPITNIGFRLLNLRSRGKFTRFVVRGY